MEMENKTIFKSVPNFCGMYKVVNWMMFAEWDNTHNAVLGLALGHETQIQLKSNSIVKLSNLG